MTAPRRPATAGVPRSWARFVRTDRRRSWLLAGCVFALVLAYLVIWTTYAGSHLYPRYRQLAAGATASSGSEHYRVSSLVTTDAVRTKDGDLARPDAGAVYVVAEVTLTLDVAEEYPTCGLLLLGPDGRTWETQLDGPFTDRPYDCSEGVRLHTPFAYQLIYQVPQTYAGRLRGLVVVNDLTGAPSQVITPATR